MVDTASVESLGNLKPATVAFVDKTAKPATTYVYNLRARDADYNGSEAIVAAATTPKAPSNVLERGIDWVRGWWPFGR